ncbi:MAG: GAF domain-containing protein [Bacteroidales bacterium]|nr:GAF domain-containing protein [Bacteroidales bacterium]
MEHFNFFGKTGKPRIFYSDSYFILSCGVLLFFTAYKLGDKQKLENLFETVRNEERLKFYKANESTEIKSDIEKIDYQELVNTITPDMRSMKNAESFCNKLLSNISSHVEILSGLCYVAHKKSFVLSGKYAFSGETSLNEFSTEESLPGQAVKDKEIRVINEIPENYFKAISGLGQSIPKYLVFVPVIFNSQPVALLEMATFKPINDHQMNLFSAIKEDKDIGEKFTKITKN